MTSLPPGPRWKLLLAFLIGFSMSCLIGCMVLFSRLDDRIAITPYRTSTLYSFLLVFVLATLIVAGLMVRRGWLQRQDLSTLALRVVVTLSIPLTLSMALVVANIFLDDEGTDYELVVSDIFEIQRERGLDRYIAMTLPNELGGTKLWYVQRWVDLGQYPPGTRIRITHHEGFFGQPWTDIHDRTITHSARFSVLQQRSRGTGRALRAVGRFADDSPYRSTLKSWGVAIDADRDPTAVESPM